MAINICYDQHGIVKISIKHQSFSSWLTPSEKTFIKSGKKIDGLSLRVPSPQAISWTSERTLQQRRGEINRKIRANASADRRLTGFLQPDCKDAGQALVRAGPDIYYEKKIGIFICRAFHHRHLWILWCARRSRKAATGPICFLLFKWRSFISITWVKAGR